MLGSLSSLTGGGGLTGGAATSGTETHSNAGQSIGGLTMGGGSQSNMLIVIAGIAVVLFLVNKK